jgi:hypothetical protein
VSAVVFGPAKLGHSPTSRLQWTAQARFLLGLSLVEVGLAGEIGVKSGQLLPVRWCRMWGLSLGKVSTGPPLKRSVSRLVKTLTLPQVEMEGSMRKQAFFRIVALIAFALLIMIGFILKDSPSLTGLANIAQLIQGIVVLVLLLIAADIREAVKSRHLEGIRYVKDLIGSNEASEQRKWVYQELKKISWPLTDEHREIALAVCRDFDHIGYLCRKGLIPVDLIVETYNRNILDMWNRLERFIIQWRKQIKDEDYFWEFEWLAHEAEVTKKKLDKKHQG